MQFLRNCWYTVGWLDDFLAPGQMMRVVMGVELTIERNEDGVISAWSGRDRGRPIAIEIRHRIIWAWFGDTVEADKSKIPNLSCFDGVKDTAFFCGELPTNANYELLTDNILDLSHADFLHPTTLGGMMTRTEPVIHRDGDTIVVTWESLNGPALPIMDFLLPRPGMPADVKFSVRWHPAAVMHLKAYLAPAGEPYENWFLTDAAHIMTPESPFRTHYFYGTARNYRTDDAEFNAFQAEAIGFAFAHEDKPVIEAQQREMGDAEFWSLRPALLTIDKGPVLVRRTLAQLIRREQERQALV